MVQVVQKFQRGEFNVLVATCIGEEGLDIGEVDMIICYDAQKTPIRMVGSAYSITKAHFEVFLSSSVLAVPDESVPAVFIYFLLKAEKSSTSTRHKLLIGKCRKQSTAHTTWNFMTTLNVYSLIISNRYY